VGKAIQGVSRENVYLVSKVWRENLQYDDVLRAVEGSLRRLGTDYLDLYLVHWPNENVPMQETMRAMEHLLDEGVVRAIGVSNFSVAQMDEVRKCLTHSSLAASEFEFNLSNQEAMSDVLPYCTANDILSIAYRPLAKGQLPSVHSEGVNALAQKYGKTPNQILLNWILSQGVAAIPKTLSPEHMRENVGALGWSLLSEDIELLRI
jgi:diketogulonate reductase-like aldo/keto reductase